MQYTKKENISSVERNHKHGYFYVRVPSKQKEGNRVEGPFDLILSRFYVSLFLMCNRLDVISSYSLVEVYYINENAYLMIDLRVHLSGLQRI